MLFIIFIMNRVWGDLTAVLDDADIVCPHCRGWRMLCGGIVCLVCDGKGTVQLPPTEDAWSAFESDIDESA